MTDPLAEPILPKEHTASPTPWLSLSGCVLAFLGVAFCFYSSQVQDPEPPPKLTLYERVASAAREKMGLEQKQEREQQEQVYQKELAATQALRKTTRLTGGGLGLLALVCGVAGYVRKESQRPVMACAGLAFTAIAFEYAMIAFGVFVLLLILSAAG